MAIKIITDKRLVSGLTAFMLLIGFFAISHAATVTWIGSGTNSLASTPTNWTGSSIPHSGDDIIFDNSVKDCTWDINLILSSLIINSGYNGIIILDTDLSVTGNVNISGGTLILNNGNLMTGATPPSLPPTVTSDPASNINGNAATLNATVNPNGFETTVYFEWGTDTSYGNSTAPQSIGNGTGNIAVSTDINRLSINTIYHYRAVAANASGTTYGSDEVFTTLSGTVKSAATISADTTWTYAGSPYIITGNISVYGIDSEPTLTIEPGVEVRFSGIYYLSIGYASSKGRLVAIGTSSAPIIFTSLNHTPGGWEGLRLYNHAELESALDYVIVEYGGFSAGGGGSVIHIVNSSPVITNSVIRYGISDGINIVGSSYPVIAFSTISNNPLNGIKASGTGDIDISFNNIIDNGQCAAYSTAWSMNMHHCNILRNGCGVYSSPGKVVDAGFNWWGDTSGPSGMGPGMGQSVSSRVIFEPWLGTDFSYPLYNSEFSADLQEFNQLTGSVESTFSISEDADWIFRIKNMSGDTLRTYNGSGSTGTVIWNGRDSNDVIVFDDIYYYELNSTGRSSGLQSTSVMGDVRTVGGLIAITAPSNLAAVIISSTQVNLSWTDNSDNETGFKIERKTVGGAYSQIGTAGANTITYSDTNLTSGTYYYRVRANNLEFNSAYSNAATAALWPPTAITSDAVYSPSGTWFNGINIDRYSAGLSATVNPNGYNTTVYFEWWKDINNKNSTPTRNIGNGTNNIYVNEVITGLLLDSIYYFRIVANNSVGQSFGDVKSFTTASPTPSDLTATAISASRIDLSWTDNSLNETGFTILRRESPENDFYIVSSVGPNVTTFSDTWQLEPNWTYTYVVRAQNGSDVSNTASTTTMAVPPDVRTDPATAITRTSALLNAWVDPNNAATTVYFEWGTDTFYGNTTSHQSIGSNASYVSANMTVPIQDATYHYRVVASNAGGTSYGLDESFTADGTHISGTISNDTTWTLAGSPYIVTGNVTVAGDPYGFVPTLTIAPGVIVKFNEGASLYIGASYSTKGILRAQGTAALPIVFTSNKPVPATGDWGGIFFTYASAESILEYATVEYGGYYSPGGIIIYESFLTVTNSTIRYNNADGIYISGETSDITIADSTISGNLRYGVFVGNYIDNAPYISNTSFDNNGSYPITLGLHSVKNLSDGNTYSQNVINGIELRGSSISSDVTIPYQNTPYIITSGITVAGASPDPVLTVEPGVVMKFNTGTYLEIGGIYGTKGILKAQGTSSSPIVLTSNQNPANPGDWGGIYFYNHASEESVLEHVTVEYGGDNNYGTLSFFDNTPTITDSIIRYGKYSGIYLIGNSAPTISETIISNNGSDGVYAAGTGKVDITFSELTNNTDYAVYSTVPVLNVNHSNIANNGDGVYSSTGKIADARFNWWGNATGPSDRGPGSGQPVSSGIKFESWLGAAYTYPFHNTDLHATLQEFSPLNNAAGYIFTISDSADWMFSIKNSGGTIVKAFTGSGNAGEVSWDGKDGNGVIVPNGIYTYHLSSTRLSDSSQSAPLTGDVNVNIALPKAEITNPVDRQFIGSADIQGTAADNDFKDYKVEYGIGTAPETWTLITSSMTQVNNGTLAAWNPTILTGTYYTIRLSAIDYAGNTATDSVEIQLLLNNLSISPSDFSPNGDGFEDTVAITANIVHQSSWTLDIKDPAGTVIKSFNGSGTSLSVIWDGRNASGMIQPEGAYTFTITVTDSVTGTSVVVSGTITIDFTPAPVAITEDTDDVFSNSATILGSVNPRGSATTAYFDWGTSNTPYEYQTTTASIGAGNQFIDVGSNLTWLLPGMTYHFRIVAASANGTSYGQDNYFVTRGSAKPDAITDPATDITDNSVTLNARANPRSSTTTVYFEWGTDVSYGNSTSPQSIGDRPSLVRVPANLTGILPGMTYHYRVVAVNDNGTTYGYDMSFTTTITLPPVISNIAVSNITTNSAVITWTTDHQADSVADYGITTAYESLASDSALTTSHSVTLTNLQQSTTYHYKVTSTNDYDLSSSSGDNTFTTSGPITITIVAPVDNATINRPDVMVRGTVTNATGNETGVTINGMVATVYNGQFFVNHVPLTDGQNTVTASAKDTAANNASHSIIANANTTAPHVTLSANIESGIAPLTTYFSVSTSIPNSVTSYAFDYEGDAVVDYSGTTFDNISVTYSGEGIALPTVTVTDDQSYTYSDTIAIVVLNASQLDTLLKAKWNGMKTVLANQDVDGALVYFTESSNGMFRYNFELMQSMLPTIVQDMGNITLRNIENGHAEYEMNTVQQDSSLRSHFIEFIVDLDGIWKINFF